MEMIEKITGSKRIFDGRVVKLRVDDVLLTNGHLVTREVVEHNGGVCVVAADENGDLLLVRQYRHPFGTALLELPAGKLEAGEPHRDAALRELEEETGYLARDLEFLGEMYPTPAYCSEIIYIYRAKDLQKTAQHLDEDEFLQVERVPFAQAVRMVLDGTIKDAKTQIGIMMYESQRHTDV